MVDFWFEELGDERDENLAEDGRPFFVVRGSEICGKQSTLKGREGLLTEGAAGVETLVRECF